MIPERQILRLLSSCLPVWRRAGSPAHGIVFEIIARAWGLDDRSANPESYEVPNV